MKDNTTNTKKKAIADKKAARKKKQTSKNTEFSKRLIWQESALIWVITISFIILAFVCVKNAYFGELPWLTAMVGLPWTAYAVSQAFYYRKAMKENTKDGIKYETTMAELQQDLKQEQEEFNMEMKLEQDDLDCEIEEDSNAVG